MRVLLIPTHGVRSGTNGHGSAKCKGARNIQMSVGQVHTWTAEQHVQLKDASAGAWGKNNIIK